MRQKIAWSVLATLVAATLFRASATPIHGTPVPEEDWVGSRSIGSGLDGTGQFWSKGFTLSWEITWAGDALLYTYTTSGYSPLSHLILELSQGCIENGGSPCIWGANISDLEFKPNWGPGPGNPGFPSGSSIYGVKFDKITSDTISFYSNRLPMWGNFYAKKGKDGAWNDGLSDPSSEDPRDFVPVPDTYVIPEPGTLFLLGGGLFGLGMRRWVKV